jgi:hypothetical protein
MSASTDIIEKIKKLLRLARSSNPHEAQLAMQRAMQLAREHDVAVEGLDPDAQAKVKTVTHQDTEARQRLSYDKEYAVMICQRFFRVSAIFRTKVAQVDGWPVLVRFVSFVGTASDIAIALYVYGFLVHHFAFCWRRHRGRLRNRHAFVDGMFHGIHWQLSQAEPVAAGRNVRGDELVLAEHNAYIGTVIGKTASKEFDRPDHEATAASLSGFNHGRNTTIAPALRPSDQPAPLALCT